MAIQDNVLRLLVAERSLNDAEMLVSVLRNAGHAVRPTRVEDEDSLREALGAKTFDMLLYTLGFEDLSLEQTGKIIQQAGKDIPIVVVAPSEDPESRIKAMTIGAVDLVSKADLKHLQLVIKRELTNLNLRRRLRRVEASLREVEKRCHSLLDNSRDAIAYVHEGMHIYANKAYLERFGFESMDDIEGMPLLNMAAPQDQAKLKEFLRNYQKHGDQEQELEITMLANDDGRELHVVMTFSPASIDGEPCTQILMRSQGAPAELVQQLDSLSKQDLLTGLYNRQHFMEELEKNLAKALAEDSTAGLLFLQLDNLEGARQALGITGIDTLISDIGGLIRAEIGQDGIAARFSDEAFTILLPNEGVHAAIALGEALRHAIEEHICESGGRTFTTTCSIGITVMGERTGTAQAALHEALTAADQARAQGGNQVVLHATDDDKAASGSELTQLLEDALVNDQYFLVFQPVVSLQGDNRERYEVRLRLQTANGVMMPADFIPHAEQAGLMPAVDRWVVRTALRTLSKHLAAKHDTILFLKLSGPTLADADFLGYLAEQLKATGVSGNRLVFQVNEPVAVTQLTHAREAFRGLKQLGCGFSLDHFGSGLNPFQLVKHLPADYLKVDAQLTHNLSESEENQQNIKNLINTAHTMQKQVVAGYLEDASSLALLWQFGADFVQGRFLKEPEPEMNYDFAGMSI